MKYSLSKVVVSLILVVWYFAMPKVGFVGCENTINHLLYPFSHANIWHLAANLLCLWMIPCKLHLIPAYACAMFCSYLPCFVMEPTMGLSGLLFAIVGMSWGRVHRFRDMIWKNKWFLVIPIFIPHVNALLHVYCLVVGYLMGRYIPMKKTDWV